MLTIFLQCRRAHTIIHARTRAHIVAGVIYLRRKMGDGREKTDNGAWGNVVVAITTVTSRGLMFVVVIAITMIVQTSHLPDIRTTAIGGVSCDATVTSTAAITTTIVNKTTTHFFRVVLTPHVPGNEGGAL